VVFELWTARATSKPLLEDSQAAKMFHRALVGASCASTRLEIRDCSARHPPRAVRFVNW